MTRAPSARLPRFNQLANAAARDLGEAIMCYAEDPSRKDHRLPEADVFVATVVGATTGALKVLSAAAAVGMVPDRQTAFETLMRQMADAWSQLDDQPAAGSTIQ